MNWDAIGAVGEIVGALAVVLSLIYLSRQIRDSTKTIKATSKKDVFMWWSEWCREMSAHPDGVLHNRSLDPNSSWTDFNYEQQTVIGYLCRAVVMRFESEFSLSESGLLEPEIWEEHRAFCLGLLQRPTWAEWWKDEMEYGLLTKRFMDNINDARAKAIMGPTPYNSDTR